MIVGTHEEWIGSNVKRRAHMRSVILVSVPKRSHQQEKWSVEFGSDDKELVHDEEGNDSMVVLWQL